MRRTIVIAAVWLAAVVAGAAVGIATLGALDGTDPANAPLSPRDVEAALARGSAPAPTVPAPLTPSSPAPTGTASRSYFSNPGGTLWASCSGGLVTLSSVTPSQGFRIDDRQLGPATSTRVKFKADVRRGHAAEYRVTVTCAGGVPQASQEADD